MTHFTDYRMLVPKIVTQFGLPAFTHDTTGVDQFLPLLEKMRQEGAIVLFKFDGERTSPEDSGPYTGLVSGKMLGDNFARIDTHALEDAIAYIIVHYARAIWGFEE